MAGLSVDGLVAELGAAGVPAGRVNTKAQLAADPQLRHNTLLHDTLYPGLGRLRTPRAAAQFIGLPHDDSRQAPHLGQHSRELLRELGRSEADIAALYGLGAVR